MFKSSDIRNAYKERVLIRIVMAVFIMTMSVPGFVTIGNSEAYAAGSIITCGHDSICNSITGREFDLILYSSLGSEMVVLYSRDKIGELTLSVPESYYSRKRGNVRDAIYYLSRHSDYSGFRFRKARKKTGFFSSKIIDGLYVAIPKYRNEGNARPPEYSFSEKNGELRIRISPVIRPMDN